MGEFDSFTLIHAEDDATDPSVLRGIGPIPGLTPRVPLTPRAPLVTPMHGVRLRKLDGAIFAVGDGLTCIGRSPLRIVQLADADVSRKHAEIVRRGDRYVLRDMNTPNGTFLNGERIRGEVSLAHGDELRLGRTTLVFEFGT
jgi:hypothetical protein